MSVPPRPPTTSTGRGLTAVIAVLCLCALIAGAGLAGAPRVLGQQTPSDASRDGSSPGDGPAPGDGSVAIVIDASSSMLEADVGSTRLAAAQSAARELVDSLPEGARVGMLAYGTEESDASDNRDAACRDVVTLAPVQPVDKAALTDRIDGLTARGYTPIGNALLAAAEELGDEGERSIVLVSDGLDTCAPPDPCEVAGDLAGAGVDMTVHTVGFLVDDAARAQLECIAGATGGRFTEASDAASLSGQLQFLTRRGIEGYQTRGTPFEMGLTLRDAPMLGEGLYLSELTGAAMSGGRGPAGHLGFEIPDGHIAHVSATLIPPVDPDPTSGVTAAGLRIEADHVAEECRVTGSDTSYEVGGGWKSPGATHLVIPATENEPACSPDGYRVIAQRTGVSASELEVEVLLQFEPVPSDGEITGYPAVQSVPADAPAPDFGAAVPVAGGTSFNGADAVGPGTYSDALVPGETRFYRVPVEWGERLALGLRVPGSVRGALDHIQLEVANPFRVKPSTAVRTTFEDGPEEVFLLDTIPVQYRNRDGDQEMSVQSQAGEHYIMVSLNDGSNSLPRGIEQPFELAVAIDGEPAPGPDWRPVFEDGPEPGLGGVAPTAPDQDPTAVDDESVEAADEGADGGAGWAWIAGGVLVVALAVVVGVALVRGRRGGGAGR
ncbi:VWA domain-containing protein [Dietzia sp. UCD-THP]|uniref:vWA domain-containing protein n=1 Tax=Dietzia sp. UCD-THP TaxID=1292020 RepID=UPI001268B37E|nr:VWA domain-containing protein [Dietzia sp. UCD-THP]